MKLLVGEGKDPSLLKNVEKALELKGVSCEIRYNDNNEIYSLFVTHEEDLEIATDCMRTALGHRKEFAQDAEWTNIQRISLTKYTKIILILCIGPFLLKTLKLIPGIDSYFLFGSPAERSLFGKILQGELWRGLTPIFLHFGSLHIFFNLMWFKDIGTLVEHFKGPKFFLFFICASGLLSNLGQYLFQGPSFGGMSGVVFALVGLIWIDPFFKKNKVSLPKRDLFLMLGWYFLCLFNIIPQVANMAHGVGLCFGMAVGLVLARKEWESVKWIKHFGLFTGLGVLTVGIEVFRHPTLYFLK